MTRKSFWLAGAAAAALWVSAATPSLAAPASEPVPPALTYADLLEPVPDAPARLFADDAAREAQARLILADDGGWGPGFGHHHHHHHHHHHSWQWYRDNGYGWNGSGWYPIPQAHHHHHAWQWYRARGYFWNGWAWAPGPHHHHHHHHPWW
jgi:hypothetical protein